MIGSMLSAWRCNEKEDEIWKIETAYLVVFDDRGLNVTQDVVCHAHER